MRTLEESWLVVGGVRAPVLIGGAGEPGEAVVFVHGNPGAGSDWEPPPLSDIHTWCYRRR